MISDFKNKIALIRFLKEKISDHHFEYPTAQKIELLEALDDEPSDALIDYVINSVLNLSSSPIIGVSCYNKGKDTNGE